MKFVFFLVALLHLLQLLVQGSDHNVSSAIIKRLEKLNNLGKDKINFTLPELRVPSPKMQKKAVYCVSVFKEILLEVLTNMTVPAGNENLIVEITNDLSILSNETKKSDECIPKVKTWNEQPLKPFTQYIYYLQKLNRNRRSV